MKESPPEVRGGRLPSLARTVIRVGEVATAITAIGGLVGDVLRPLASINLTVFLAASAASAVLVVLCLQRRRVFGYGLGLACLFCLLLAVGFGAWWGVAEFRGGRERGFLAGKFAVVGRVQDAVLDARKVDGTGLARGVTQEQARTERAATSLADIFRGYPADVLKAGTPGGLKAAGSSGGQVTVAYDLNVGVDPARYEAFVDRLVPALDDAAVRKGETFSIARAGDAVRRNNQTGVLLRNLLMRDNHDKAKLMQGNPGDGRLVLLYDGGQDGFGADWWKQKVDPEREMVVVVNTARNQRLDRTTWRWFVVPRSGGFAESGRVDVRFLDGRGREVVRDVLTLGPLLPGLFVQKRPFSDQSWNAVGVIVSPFILDDRAFLKDVTIPLQLEMTRDELKSIATVQCSAPADRP